MRAEATGRLAELLAMPLEVFVRDGEPLVVCRPASRTEYLVPDFDWAEALVAAGAHPRRLWVACAEFKGAGARMDALVRRLRGQAIGYVRRELLDELAARGLR
jgi:hypothetical protein